MNFIYTGLVYLIKGDSFGKVFTVINILFSQFFFLILISYVGEDSHILGEAGLKICDFLIKNFLGLSAFALPLAWFYLSFSLLKKQRNISEILRHLVWFFSAFFWGNVLLLNTPIINTAWAGLLPKFFHALISRAFTDNFGWHPLTFGFEVVLLLLPTFFLLMSYFNWSYGKVFHSVLSLIKNGYLEHPPVQKKEKHQEMGREAGSVHKKTKKNWKLFWKDMFGFIRRVDDNQVKEYLGIDPSALPASGFTLMKLDRFQNPQPLGGNGVFESSFTTAPSENREAGGKDTTVIDEGLSSFTTPDPSSDGPETKPSEETEKNEIIDFSSRKFFEFMEAQAQVQAQAHKEDIPMNEATEEEEEIPFDEEEGRLFKEEITPSVINSKNISQKECLAEEKKLVFSQNPSRSQTLDIEMKKTCEKLENTIREFGINTQVVNVSQGPVITQYELTLEPGVHINRIVNLSDNIALSLAAESVRIVAPIPGKAVIGIEIPNKIREMVTLRDIVDKRVFKESHAKLPIALGSSVSGKPIIADLTATPHLLVAGATGSGKSVCVNSIICSLLLRRTPEQVRFLMIDPKMVELNIYNGIPHLLSPVITDPQKAALTLKWAISEMEARYRLLEKFGVRNISSYNQMVEKERDFRYGTLPYIVIIIDEFADLMMVARKEIEDSVSRLAAMSRAIGIHLLLATQRPSVDVITGVIKANFPSRIAFQVSSKIDSRTIIDSMGAEKLLGKGDMLYQNAATGNPYRIQGTFLSDEEVREIVSDLKGKKEAEYVLNLKDEIDSEESSDPELEDEIFKTAVEVAKKEGKISTSLIQRRLRIGYNRAARIVELMEEKGIVGASDGVRPREVLVSNF